MSKKQYAKVLEVTDAGLFEKNGDVKPYIKMVVEMPEGSKEVTWYGNLKGSTEEKQKIAVDMTVKTLVTAGFMGNDFPDLAVPGAAEFFMKKDLQIAYEYYNDKLQVTNIYANKPKNQFSGTAPKFANVFAQAKLDAGIKDTPF